MKKLLIILSLIFFYKPLIAKEGEMGFGIWFRIWHNGYRAKDTAQTIANLLDQLLLIVMIMAHLLEDFI